MIGLIKETKAYTYGTLASLVTVVMLTGCARPTTTGVVVSQEELDSEQKYQRQIALEHFIEQVKTLDAIGLEILSASRDLCGDRLRADLGFTMISPSTFSGDMLEFAASHLSLEEGKVWVGHVRKGSPADLAGVKPGDILKTLNNEEYSVRVGEGWFGREFKVNVPKLNEDGTNNTLTVARMVGGVQKELEFQLDSVEICDYGIQLSADQQVNAYADGDNIIFTTSIMNTLDEDKLRVIAAHELAHNIMNHLDAKQQNFAAGLLLDTLVIVGTGIDPNARLYAQYAYSEDFEAEADYVGMYIYARTGWDFASTPDLWRRMAVLFPESVFSDGESFIKTHPSNPARFKAMESAIAEIKAKQENGEPLLPNLQE